jgi:hypothetical protein
MVFLNVDGVARNHLFVGQIGQLGRTRMWSFLYLVVVIVSTIRWLIRSHRRDLSSK